MSAPSMYHKFAKPPFFCSTCRGSLSPASFSGPPSWKLAVSCSLTQCSPSKRWNSKGSSTPIHGRLPDACRAATRPRVSTATIRSINISLLCTTIIGHWREPFLFNMRQVLMFPCCCCRVLGEKPRRRLAHCLPFDHPKAIFSSALILAGGPLSEPFIHESSRS